MNDFPDGWAPHPKHRRLWERTYLPGLTAEIWTPDPQDGWPVYAVEVVLGPLSTYFLCDTQEEAVREADAVVWKLLVWRAETEGEQP